jgi:hypothetical protein
MVRFLVKGAALALIVVVTGTAVIALPGGYLHELAAIINKRDILVSRKPPRLIFMGGSNLLTLNGPMLERELKIPVVNMGLYAMIPLEDYFDDIARYLSPGDIVVIVQEYQSLINAGSGVMPESDRLRVEQFMFLLSPCKYFIRNIKRGTPFDIARIWVSLIQLKLKAFIKFGTAGKIAEALKPGVPRFDSLFDVNGGSRLSFLVARPLQGEGNTYPEPDPESIACLRQMIEDGTKRGARVYYSFPPTPESNFNLNRRQIAGLFDIMKKNIPGALINSPVDHCYPDGYFADTVNHLQAGSEQIRSRKLAEALKIRIQAR